MSQTPTTYEPYTPGRPGPEDRRPVDPSGHPSDGALNCLLLASVVCVVIWVASGFGYFWPIWVILPALLLRAGGRSRSAHRGCARR